MIDTLVLMLSIQEDEEEEKAVIGFWSAFSWLVGMTIIIAVLSEYVVGTIEVCKASLFCLLKKKISI